MNWDKIYGDQAEGLPHSSAIKRRWLAEAKRCFPIGCPVKVTGSDLDEYVGATGFVVGYDLGTQGEWPLIQIAFCPVLSPAPEHGNGERDSFEDDELEALT